MGVSQQGVIRTVNAARHQHMILSEHLDTQGCAPKRAHTHTHTHTMMTIRLRCSYRGSTCRGGRVYSAQTDDLLGCSRSGLHLASVMV